MAGANVLATGPFSGGSMNPACAFGSAVVAGSFKNQAVYWVGPLFGAAVAGLVYDIVVFPAQVQDSIAGVSDGIGGTQRREVVRNINTIDMSKMYVLVCLIDDLSFMF
ncbi:hypothetical protein CISIN_1g042738mg [Citrus sinensis]|uniref:Aquaporin n=1 Tax=Citrus sinensis TaxID=2711 RepID=A0A067D0S1_CITSI|nr:hypothetical protein CISIN_1g042738mg [Citrus sinensis]